MATNEQIAALRRMVAEPGTETYLNTELSALIDEAGTLDKAATIIWGEKAAVAAELVNVSESGSSRSLQQIHSNALSMAKYYDSRSTVAEEVVDLGDAPFTVGTVRS